MGTLIGGGFALLALGFFVVEICFPIEWRTKGVWMATSFIGIPAFLLLITLAIAWPPLFVLGLIVAFAAGPMKKRH